MRQNFMRTMEMLVLLLFVGPPVHARQPAAKTLRFSGYEWEVRGAGVGGPGPNQWEVGNARVDDNGWLHLRIARVQGEWRSVELTTRKRFGFGRYQFQVMGNLAQFDRNIVLGLFNYPTPDVGKDGTNEIDIEFAHWGNLRADGGNYTVYPAQGERSLTDHNTFAMTTPHDLTTHRFVWTSDQVFYQSLIGLRDDDAQEITHWKYAPGNTRLIPQKPLPVHINLWLFQGKPPVDQKEVEIVIRQFTFIPADLLPTP